MVLFIEACESGSMFVNLSSNDSGKYCKWWGRSLGRRLSDCNVFGCVVYAVTAANPYESSWACYYDSKLKTYLGDLFSVNWMENVDAVRAIE